MKTTRLRSGEMIKIGDYIKNSDSKGKVLGKVVNIYRGSFGDGVYCRTDTCMMWPVRATSKATDEEAMLWMLEN
jgi:hypothetical protein